MQWFSVWDPLEVLMLWYAWPQALFYLRTSLMEEEERRLANGSLRGSALPCTFKLLVASWSRAFALLLLVIALLLLVLCSVESVLNALSPKLPSPPHITRPHQSLEHPRLLVWFH